MKNSKLIASITAALALTAGSAFAEMDMEKCAVVNKEGKGAIKEHKSDCKTSAHSCAGQNMVGEADAWISVPKGKCTQINAGDFSGVDKKITDKIDMTVIKQ